MKELEKVEALEDTQYCYVRYSLGWMNMGMVLNSAKVWWADYYHRTPDRQYGEAMEVVFMPFCFRDHNFMPENLINEHATERFTKSN